MFRRPTVLVVGAGASLEAGFPVGSSLLRKLAQSVHLSFQFNRLDAGDPVIEFALRKHCMAAANQDPHAGIELMNEYVRAGWRISESSKEGLSIDAIIDQHENDRVEFMGKLGITKEILEAEGSSKLASVQGGSQPLNLERSRDTWLPRFGRLLVESRRISDLDNVFENLTIITFNYDRSIEHYLPSALVAHYGISLDRARELVSTLTIIHPFGTVGRLPWMPGNDLVVEFGNLENANLVDVSRQVQTFTEQMADQAGLAAMRGAMAAAERIVFLGFAYHRPNMALLRPPEPTRARSIFGTVKGISSNDQQVVVTEIADTLQVDRSYVTGLDNTCTEVFDQNWRSLTA